VTLAALLGDYTIQTVAAGGALLGTVGGVLGAFAVLRQQSLLGDTLSHAALPGICLGFLVAGARQLEWLLAGAFVTGAAAALTVLLIANRSRLKMDAALGVVLSVYFAVGVVLLTFVQGSGGAGQAGLSAFLFGQAAAMLRADLPVMGGITVLVLLLVLLLWKELKLATFDPGFAAASGLPVAALEVALTVMIALAIVVGLQLVGVVLMTAMIVAPPVAARQWTGRLESMVLLSAGFGVVAGVGGAVISASARGLSTGPVIVLTISAIVLASLLFAPGRGIAWSALAARAERRRLRGNRVLMTLYRLARAHEDPRYPAEKGTLDAYHRMRTDPTLARLEAQGLVRPVTHEPEPTPHWELTQEGHDRAAGLSAEGGQAGQEGRP
jgi:manganese/zinc/iron transport system permease protein